MVAPIPDLPEFINVYAAPILRTTLSQIVWHVRSNVFLILIHYCGDSPLQEQRGDEVIDAVLC
jgi:hypothetical protein